MNLLSPTPRGLYCPAGDFFIDPCRPVSRALITHAHADHAIPGSHRYLACSKARNVLTRRLRRPRRLDLLDYGERRRINGVNVSFHPAGHVHGSAQIRLEYRKHVWVVSGDYKLSPDPTCAGFEPVGCDVFVTESTFGQPVFQWPDPVTVFEDIQQWWRENQQRGLASVIYAYALGKAQRLVASLDLSLGPLHVHPAVHRINQDYRCDGVALPDVPLAASHQTPGDWSRTLIIAIPSAHRTAWLSSFGPIATASVSGWMLPAARDLHNDTRWNELDRGFALSDHADWNGILNAVNASGAKEVWVTHGSSGQVAQHLESLGLATRQVGMRVSDRTNNG